MRAFEHFIDGRFEPGARRFESLNPATEEPWATMPAAGAEEVDRAVRAAHRALTEPAWAGLSATQRGKLLHRLAELVARDAGALARLETADTGKVIRETSAQVGYVAEFYRYYAGLADKLAGAQLPVDKPDMEVLLRREPIGVVAAVVPWNSQLFLAAVKLAPALAAGCTVVLKASEDGPAPLLAFARLVQEAGFPPGTVNILTGFGAECGGTLTSHPLIARVAFTGGPETARQVVRNTAANFAATTLELGGKSPVLVFEDADAESALNAVVAGIFAASGQSCVAGSRLLLQRRLAEPFLDRLAKRARRIRIGDPADPATEMGPLATAQQRERLEAVVADSRRAGARLLAGGGRPAGFPRGFYVEPTILLCDGVEAPVTSEELFGPVLAVETFEDEAEALAKANATPYALAAGLFTRDLARAHRLARGLRSGIVWINTYRAISPIVPFGGFGDSGYGRESGAEALLDYTRPKAVWINTAEAPMADPFVMR